ncbi:MAG: zinc ribbon domain-containing protein [Eggerthellaceae bacterium]|nr:zinc ribbon domain-containing protein [Eggerthellaceae bacterium]
MSELFSTLWTPQLQTAVTVIVIFLVILYVLSIIWVIKDAYQRTDKWVMWGIIALIPLLGLLAYCMLRPPLYKIDQEEQTLEIEMKKRELLKYGECAACGYPIEADFVLCPHCHTQLKNLCPTCHHALEPEWSICPYCATKIRADR